MPANLDHLRTLLTAAEDARRACDDATRAGVHRTCPTAEHLGRLADRVYDADAALGTAAVESLPALLDLIECARQLARDVDRAGVVADPLHTRAIRMRVAALLAGE